MSKLSCAPTLESTSSLISCVPCWLGVTGTRARWLFKNCCLWDNYKLQGARGISWEIIVISWTRSFTIRVSESGPKSRDNSTPRWRLRKSCFFNVDWKCMKLDCKWSFGWLYQPMGCRNDYALNGITFAFLGSGLHVLGSDWRRNFFESGDGFSFS